MITENRFNEAFIASFWEDSPYARQDYIEAPFSTEQIEIVEQTLGYKLPQAYIELMSTQNGGIPANTCFPTTEPTSWANNHIAISGIMGIGSKKTYALCGELGSQFMIDEWNYPADGIYVCDCPSAGHDMILLDYSECGPQGEPQVVHVDQENNYKKTFLAKDFETFIRGLVHEETFDNSEETMMIELDKIANGTFSTTLQLFIDAYPDYNFNRVLRSLFTAITKEKGFFALHNDPKSYLVYDTLFLLYTNKHPFPALSTYLDNYPEMLAFGDGDISIGDYAPAFVELWFDDRVRENKLVKNKQGYQFVERYKQMILEALEMFE